MRESDLIAQVAKDVDIPKATAERAIQSAMTSITKALKKGDTVALFGLGTFKTSIRKTRMARNPRTGEPIKVAKRRVPAFKAGKALRDSIQ